MKAFILSPEAERDLDIIKEYYLKRSGVHVARYVMRKLREGIRFVARNPEVGHFRDDLTDQRCQVLGCFLIT